MSITIKELNVSGHIRQATIWQNSEEGIGEPALHVRTWEGDTKSEFILEIAQGGNEITLNSETIHGIAKLVKKWAKEFAEQEA